MARLPRIDAVGIPQHVVVRGVDRQPCFFAPGDRALYLDLLREAAARCDVDVHAYVLMTNHVHLLVTGNVPRAVSATMHRVGARYVRRVNGWYARSGTLFEGRFRASLVQSERYVLVSMRYIELNPVRAGMVEHAEDFRWSSYRSNAGIECADWLVPRDEYRRLGRSARARGKAWRELVATPPAVAEVASIRKHLNANRALGDERFQSEIAAMLGRRVHVLPPGRPWPRHDHRGSVTAPGAAHTAPDRPSEASARPGNKSIK